MTSPLRVLRQIVAPNGKHRAQPVQFLPDGEATETVDMRELLDDSELQHLLDTGEVVANESAPCPACDKTTLHAMHRDGSRRCGTCGTETLPGGG